MKKEKINTAIEGLLILGLIFCLFIENIYGLVYFGFGLIYTKLCNIKIIRGKD